MATPPASHLWVTTPLHGSVFCRREHTHGQPNGTDGNSLIRLSVRVTIRLAYIGVGPPEAAMQLPTPGPRPEAKEIGGQKQDLAERHLTRIEFWKQLLDKAKEINPLHANVSPSKDNWVTAGAGKSGMGWSYSITMDKGSVELLIDRGRDKKEDTDRIYEVILNDREKIEEAFGETLEWKPSMN